MFYDAAWRATRAMGYRRLITYTQDGESGTSLRAAGFVRATRRPNRPRQPGAHPVARTRWEIRTSAPESPSDRRAVPEALDTPPVRVRGVTRFLAVVADARGQLTAPTAELGQHHE